MASNPKKPLSPRPEVPPSQPWEAEVETPIADTRTDGGESPPAEALSMLGNTAAGEASLGNTLPDLPPTDMGDPILTGPLVADPFEK